MADIMDDDEEEKETKKWVKRGEKANKYFHVKELLEQGEHSEPFKGSVSESSIKLKKDVFEGSKSESNISLKKNAFEGSSSDATSELKKNDLESPQPIINKDNSLIDKFSGEEIKTANSNNYLPLNINFEPNNITTIPSNVSSIHPEDIERKPFEFGLEKEPYHAGIIEEARKQFTNPSSFTNVKQYLDRKRESLNIGEDEEDPNWKPTSDPSIFYGIDQKYIPKLMGAKNKRDQQLILSNILDDQEKDKLIANGSTFGWLLGGFAGMTPVGSPESLIPIAGQVKYAKYAPTILWSMARAFPGIATSSIAHEAIINSTQTAGNLEDFVVDSFADIIFGEAFTGVGSLVSRAIDSGALWDLRKSILPMYKGIDFKVKVTEDGKFNGYKAVDTTGTLSSAQVDFAQDMADSTFAKMGIFKIPYVSEGFNYTFQVFSPIMRMLNSPYKTVRAVVDRVANHSIITEGLLAGKPSPMKFENEMDKVKGQMRAFSAQIQGLHLARNGIDITKKTRARIQSTSYLKELINKLNPDNYTSVEDFHSEIDHAIRSGESSPHAAVNEAAGMIRNILDETYAAWRKAYNLPETWLPPKTAQNYLMRVYNTPYMDLKRNEWNEVITKWLKDSDELIETHMAPINSLKEQISLADKEHQNLKRRKDVTNEQKKLSSDNLDDMRRNLTATQEQLQNELKSNEDLRIHVDDHSAVSADEAKEIEALNKPLNDIRKKVDKQKQVVAELKKIDDIEDETRIKIEQEEKKLNDLKDDFQKEEDRLQEEIHKGNINPALYDRIPDSFRYKFKDPKDRIKFRDTYESDHHRLQTARAYYDTIMNQTPEQLTAQVMRRLTGHDKTNPLKERSLLIPDHLLMQGENKFLSTNLVPNVMNYKYFLSRRTILKNIFKDVTIDGGFEPIIESLAKEHNFVHNELSNNLATITEKRKALNEELKNATSIEEQNKLKYQLNSLDKEQKAVEKRIVKESKNLNVAKEQLSIVYDKMMGNRTFGKKATKYSNMIMSYTSAIKLGFTPFSQITDLTANILQHGLWPFIRDGIIPSIESLGGILKTKDSEALRRAAPHVHLALQDVLTGYADKNFGGQAQPYFNLGSKLANGLEGMSHLSSNLAGTNYIDNGLQHITGSIAQSTFMEYMYAFKNGTLSKADHLKILKYGLDPKEWADRFINEFEKAGGHKTKFGGYNSQFWLWKDLEASNKFSDAVFRGVKDTVLQRGMLDAPFFMDHPLGSILMAFKGWTFASLNRYVIPAMQQANGEKLIGISFMLAAGALVSPSRRIASGKDPYPEDVTPAQIMWAAFQDSGFFSIFGDILADMNLFTGGWLLGNLKNERYRDRTMAGLLGPTAGIANNVYSILGSMFSREINQSDVNKMLQLIPYTQIPEFRALSNKFAEGLDIPKTRAQARKMKALED